MQKTVLITGASGNLGKAAVEKFHASDYHVVVTVTPGNKLSFPVPSDVKITECDLTQENSAAAVIDKIIEKRGALDAALLLVGGFAAGGIRETDGAALKKMIGLNFETAYYAARPSFLQMQKQATGGRIILVGARPAMNAADGKKLLGYALSKSLLFKLAEFLNSDGALQNVVTSVIVPSTIDTPENRASMPKADFSKWVKAEDIAALMELICSQKGAALREPVFKIYGQS